MPVHRELASRWGSTSRETGTLSSAACTCSWAKPDCLAPESLVPNGASNLVGAPRTGTLLSFLTYPSRPAGWLSSSPPVPVSWLRLGRYPQPVGILRYPLPGPLEPVHSLLRLEKVLSNLVGSCSEPSTHLVPSTRSLPLPPSLWLSIALSLSLRYATTPFPFH